VLARAAIRRLRTGLVPYWELDRLSVSYGKIKQVIDNAFSALLSEKPPQPVFIRGEWGTGKTHFLSFVRGMAKNRNLPAARVDLNARSSALNFPQRFYSSIAETVSTTEHEGLRGVLAEMLHDPATRSRVGTFACSGSAGDLCGPLYVLCSRYQNGEHLELMDDSAWAALYGSDLSWADYTYKREQALARIGALGRLFSAVGRGGLVVLFDEAETIDQLWNVRSRMSAYSVLGRICRQGAVFPVFGITKRFERTIESDLARGVLQYDFATDSATWFLKAWHSGQFTVLEPPTVDARNARTLAGAVAELYESAYGNLREHDRLIDNCVTEWLDNPSRNPRRLIRLLVHRLDVNCPLACIQ
jgi:hypothetical protein